MSDYRGRVVVLYFYPEDDTPLCTAQACQFRDHFPDFSKIKATVIGISPDGVESHRAFVDKHALPFTLLADPPGPDGTPAVCAMYGAFGEKNMYGKKVVAMLRTTYIIGADGRVAHVWPRVKTPGHAAAVLQAVRELEGSATKPGATRRSSGGSRRPSGSAGAKSAAGKPRGRTRSK